MFIVKGIKMFISFVLVGESSVHLESFNGFQYKFWHSFQSSIKLKI